MMKKRLMSLLLAVCLTASLLVMPAGAAGAATFPDVTDKDTAVAVESLRLMGVLDGYKDGSFRPGASLNRAQFCKMLVFAMDAEEELGRYRTVTIFPDVKPSHWASAYINMAAKGRGIIAGYTDGRFHPERTISLGQAVTFLLRLLGYKDEDLGGIWPESYMAEAAVIGLTDGVGTSGHAPLSRGQAAKLMLNLLRCDLKEGGSYLSSLTNLSTVPNSMLVSSTADGPDGRGTALQLANGAVYSLRDGKASNGVLNGSKGTLVLTKSGSKAVTFVPDSVGASKVITLAEAKVNQLTDSMGVIYAMNSAIPVSTAKGEEETWGTACQWLSAGTSLTLYLNGAGEVEYVYQGGAAASSAIVIREPGSIAGFDALTGGINNYSIYKNGSPAAIADLKRYDVAVYSGASNSIRVCDTRVSVYYEACRPSPAEPETITVLGGTELRVLPMARESLAMFRPGDRMTLLLTDDGQVAGAVSTDTGAARANALGIVQEGKVQLLCGGTKLALAAPSSEQDGKVVRVSSGKEGVYLSEVRGGAAGDLNTAARTLGGRKLAEGVMIFRDGKDVSLSMLTTQIVPKDQIQYARVNWADEVDLIAIGGTEDGSIVYGRAYVDGEGNERTLEIRAGSRSVGPFASRYSVEHGDYVMAELNQTGDGFRGVTKLTKLAKVPNSAWNSRTAVTFGGRVYTVPQDVACYNRATDSWIDLDTARAYADKCSLYVSDGVVRVMEIN